MNIILFEDVSSKSKRLFETGENHFEFWQQSSMPDLEEAKADFNEWFSYYPDDEKAKLKKDFKTEDKFYDAWYELFIHELFRRQGYELSVHPVLPNSSEHPDFLANKNRYSCYIEAKQVTGLTTEQKRKKKIKDIITDRLQKVNLPNHMLMLEDLLFSDGASPSMKKVSKWLEEVVGAIETTEIKTHADLDNRETLTYSGHGLTIKIKVLSSDYASIVKGDRDDLPHRPFGVIFEGVTISAADRGSVAITKAITTKSRKYGKLDKAFLLCLNLDNWNLDINRDVDWALFSDYPDSRGYFNQVPPKHSKVSAILFTKANPNNYRNCVHRLILNPNAEFVYHFEYSELTFEMRKTKTNLHEKKDIGDILKNS